MKKLSGESCLAAIERGDFGTEVTGAADSVAVILTQSWCPQWTWMRSYIETLPESPDRAIFWIEYDDENFYQPFMTFKEDIFGNREIPYVRYYKNGRLAKESNFIDRKGFLSLLDAAS